MGFGTSPILKIKNEKDKIFKPDFYCCDLNDAIFL